MNLNQKLRAQGERLKHCLTAIFLDWKYQFSISERSSIGVVLRYTTSSLTAKSYGLCFDYIA